MKASVESKEPRGAARKLLTAGLRELEFDPPADQLDALLGLAELLSRWSQRMNLTGHRTLPDIVRGMILEAAALAARLPPMASLADIGSGAGFPGLPIAILQPQLAVTLVEPRRKRHHFQRAAIRELRIVNALALEGRAETLEPREHGGVIAQGLAPPALALPWMLPWVEPGGWVLLPGSARAPDVPADAPVAGEECLHYRAPAGGPQRTLWIGRRIGMTQ